MVLHEFLDQTKPAQVWDLGANTGLFSRIAAEKGADTIAFELDPVCVELTYIQCLAEGDSFVLPLFQDLTNPSPGIGWENCERASLAERGPADTVLALALIHHLVIANNVPFEGVARYFASLCRYLIIEFVPKEDEQVQRLLAFREDIFPQYKRQEFEKVFSRYFRIEEAVKLQDSERSIYLMASISVNGTEGAC
jgi:ribosomal protein L11 methylase PrmA